MCVCVFACEIRDKYMYIHIFIRICKRDCCFTHFTIHEQETLLFFFFAILSLFLHIVNIMYDKFCLIDVERKRKKFSFYFYSFCFSFLRSEGRNVKNLCVLKTAKKKIFFLVLVCECIYSYRIGYRI
jgi:hypothetical protein